MSQALLSDRYARLSDKDEAESTWVPRWSDIGTWGFSLVAHLILLGILGMIHFEVTQSVSTLINTAFDEIDPEQYKFDSTAIDQVGGEALNTTLATSEAALRVAEKSPQEEVTNKVDESLGVEVPVAESGLLPLPKAEVLSAVQTSGGSELTSGGVEGALDRMAFEIANSLRERKTLVIWLFDVSPSLHEKREKIAQRVQNIYRQLTEMNVGADKALKTAVATFGEKPLPHIVTPDPVDTAEEVVKAVQSIKSEDGGKENVFAAVINVAERWLTFRTKQNRSVMIIVVTDEAGTDVQNLERAIQITKRYGMKCYVIGEGAPLGRRQVETLMTLQNGETVIGVMDRGPEGYFEDRLDLPYWGVDGRNLEFIPSGFGPYALTRLCAETNGLFLISDSDHQRFQIDPLVMRSYAPDYRPIPMLEKDIRSNMAKAALVDACRTFRAEPFPALTFTFPAENDNVLRAAITEAQRPMAVVDYRLDELVRKLEAGEKDRARITEPRWRATYDLAYGRALAMRARAYGYNAMLAEMKVSPKKFEKPGSNQWRLVASKEIQSGAVSKKIVAKAQEYLKRVIDEHAGTPWAALAEREYSTPLGWEWRESTYNPPPANNNQGAEKKGPRFVEEEDPKTGKKIKKMISDQPQRREI